MTFSSFLHCLKHGQLRDAYTIIGRWGRVCANGSMSWHVWTARPVHCCLQLWLKLCLYPDIFRTSGLVTIGLETYNNKSFVKSLVVGYRIQILVCSYTPHFNQCDIYWSSQVFVSTSACDQELAVKFNKDRTFKKHFDNIYCHLTINYADI